MSGAMTAVRRRRKQLVSRYGPGRLLLVLGWIAQASIAAAAAATAAPAIDAAQARKIVAAMRPLAREGQARAQYNMGVIYASGLGVDPDYGRALEWYRKAAAQGYARAQYNLGVLYRQGRGVTRDPARAARWFERAAAHGEAAAQNNLAVMYVRGEGVPRDRVRAVSLAAHAADAGSATAAANLDRIVADMPRENAADKTIELRQAPRADAAIVYRGELAESMVVLARRPHWIQVFLPANRAVGWKKTAPSPSAPAVASVGARVVSYTVAAPRELEPMWKAPGLKLSGQRWLARSRQRFAAANEARLVPREGVGPPRSRLRSLSLRSSGWDGLKFH